MSKYRNKKTKYNGRLFDSKKEAEYCQQLDMMKKASDISDRVVSYKCQVPFLLQDKFIDKNGNKHRAIKYLADFVVKYADGREEVVDVKSKGTTTDVYKIKKKMLLKKYPDINFIEQF